MAADERPQLPLEIRVHTPHNSRPEPWEDVLDALIMQNGGYDVYPYRDVYEFPGVTLDASDEYYDVWTIHTEAAHLWWMISAPPH